MTAQYFAQVNDENMVTHVVVVQAAFLQANPDRYPGTWVETFFDTPGKTYAGIGYTYDPATQHFIAPPTTAPEPLTEE